MRREERLVAEVRSGRMSVDEAIGSCSTNEVITVVLAAGREDLLPRPYESLRAVWERLTDRQRRLVADANPGLAGRAGALA